MLSMQDYTPSARFYWWTTFLLGTAVLRLAGVQIAGLSAPAILQVLAGAALAAVTGLFPVRVPGRKTSIAGAEIFVFLLLLYDSPLGFLRWIYTIKGMIFAQTILALPLVVTFTATAAAGIDPALLSQARAFGARKRHLGAFAVRETRAALIAAAIAAMGSALSEVGAVVIVGGNISGHTETLAGSVLASVSAGDYAMAIAVGMILLSLVLIQGAAFTVVQLRVPRAERVRSVYARGT